jgi:hypothetical protein
MRTQFQAANIKLYPLINDRMAVTFIADFRGLHGLRGLWSEKFIIQHQRQPAQQALKQVASNNLTIIHQQWITVPAGPA